MWENKVLSNLGQQIMSSHFPCTYFITMEVVVCLTCNVNPKEPFFFSTMMVRRRRSSSGLLAVTRSGFTRSRICDCRNIISFQEQNLQVLTLFISKPIQLDKISSQFHPSPILTTHLIVNLLSYFQSSKYSFSKILHSFFDYLIKAICPAHCSLPDLTIIMTLGKKGKVVPVLN